MSAFHPFATLALREHSALFRRNVRKDVQEALRCIAIVIGSNLESITEAEREEALALKVPLRLRVV